MKTFLGTSLFTKSMIVSQVFHFQFLDIFQVNFLQNTSGDCFLTYADFYQGTSCFCVKLFVVDFEHVAIDLVT